MRWFILLLLILTGARIHAGFLGDDFTVTNYNVEDGIPLTSVDNVAFDSLGFLWVATQNGLACYDGFHFRSWDIGQMGTKSRRIINFVFNPGDHRFYAVTSVYRELIKVDSFLPKSMHVTVPDILSADQLLLTNNYWLQILFPVGTKWEVGNSEVIIRLDSVWYAHYDYNQVNFYKNGFFQYRTPFLHSLYFNGSTKPIATFFEWKGALYTITRSGSVFSIQKNGSRKISLLGDITQDKKDICRSYILDNTGINRDIYIVCGKSLYKIDSISPLGAYTSRVISGFNFVKHAIHKCIEDKKTGKIILGSYDKGLYILTPRLFKYLVLDSQKIYTDLLEMPDGKILTTTGTVLDPDGKASNYLAGFRKYTDKYSVLKDSMSRIWIKTGKTITALSEDAKRKILQVSLPCRARAIQHDLYTRSIWIGTDSCGLYRLWYAADSAYRLDYIASPLRNINNIAQAGDVLWLGGFDGLCKYNISSNAADYFGELRQVYIRSIFCDKDNTSEAWVTTEGTGIFKIRKDKVYALPPDKNNFLSNAHIILQDEFGFFWISTNNGMFQVARRDMERAALNQEKIYYHHYRKASGFGTNEFNGGQNCGIHLSNGCMAFSSMNGVVYFHPARVNPLLPDQPLHIGSIIIGKNTIIPDSDTVIWEERKERMTIFLVTAYLGDKNNLYLSYRVDGGPVQDMVANYLDFNNLPPGSHEVIFFKKNGFGIKNVTQKRIIIFIKPFWYETRLFHVIVLIAIVTGIALIIQWRLRVLRKQNAKLSKMVAERTIELHDAIRELESSEKKLSQDLFSQKILNENIAHNIKTPLKLLSYTMEQHSWESDALHYVNNEVKNGLSRILANVENLSNYLRAKGGVEKDKADTFDLNILINDLITFFETVTKGSQKIAFISLISKPHVITIHYELLKQLLYNIIDNSIKHSSADTVTISLENNGQCSHLVISDNGRGMPDRSINDINSYFNDENNNIHYPGKGLGLRIIKELQQYLGIKICFSNVSAGIQVVLIIADQNLNQSSKPF